MPPKKKEVQKLSYGEFMANDTFGGSWADEVEETYESGTQPLPAPDRRFNSSFNSYGNDRGFSRDSVPQRIPDRPPYLAHLGNLDYEIVEEDIRGLLEECGVTSIRLIEDRETKRPKGFGYAEFSEVEGLKQALAMDGTSFRGRTIKIRIADPPKDRDRGGESSRDLSEWTRKGPLPDLPGRGSDRRSGPGEFAERRPPRDAPADEHKFRDLTWERKGPLSPLPQQERPESSRDGSRSRAAGGVGMESRSESFRGNRRASPAAWGEGRSESNAGAAGSRPPRREFSDRPERAPTAAERDMQWRSNMRPDGPSAKSPAPSRSGSEAPPSPGLAAALPVSRPKLHLAKRTVSDAPDAAATVHSDAKSSPFGAARPINTAAREREIEEKREHVKKEAEEKAKEDQRKAKEAKEAAAQAAAAAKVAEKEAAEKEAAQKAAEKAAEKAAKKAAEEAAKETETAKAARDEAKKPASGEENASGEKPADDGAAKGNSTASDPQNGPVPGQKVPLRPKEPRENIQNAKSRATDSGNWRQASGDQRGHRGPPGPRRGSGVPRGPRNDRSRANGGGPPSQPSTPKGEEFPGGGGPDEEGWETVPNKGRRGQKPRVA